MRTRQEHSRVVHILGIAAFILSGIPGGASVAQPKERVVSEQHETDGPSAEPIATWRDGEVTAESFASWLRFTSQEPDPSQRQPRIERMLLTLVLAQQALDSGDDDDPKVRAEIALNEDKKLVKLLREQINENIVISEDEIEEYLKKFPDVLMRPRKIRLRNLFLRYPIDADLDQRTATRHHMLELRREIELGSDFAAVAKRESDSQTRFSGGLMGNLSFESLPPHLAPVAKDLEEGALSGIIETPDGLTILKCEGIIEARQPSLETRKKEIVPHLRRFRMRDEWASLRNRLLTEAQPRIDLQTKGEAGAPSGTVAEFKGGVLTQADLDALLRERQRVARVPQLTDERLTEMVENRVFEFLAASEARAQGLHLDSAFSEAQHWQRILILASRTVENHINAKLAPIDQKQAQQFFRAHPEKFMRLPHFKLSLIRLDLKPGLEQTVYRKTVKLQSKLTAGDGDFAAIAKAHSDHPSGADGGSLGLLSRRQLAAFGPEVFRTVKGLVNGEISEIVQHQQSLFILKLEGYEPERPLAWEEAAERAKALLGTQQSQHLKEELEHELTRKLNLQVQH